MNKFEKVFDSKNEAEAFLEEKISECLDIGIKVYYLENGEKKYLGWY